MFSLCGVNILHLVLQPPEVFPGGQAKLPIHAQNLLRKGPSGPSGRWVPNYLSSRQSLARRGPINVCRAVSLDAWASDVMKIIQIRRLPRSTSHPLTPLRSDCAPPCPSTLLPLLCQNRMVVTMVSSSTDEGRERGRRFALLPVGCTLEGRCGLGPIDLRLR